MQAVEVDAFPVDQVQKVEFLQLEWRPDAAGKVRLPVPRAGGIRFVVRPLDPFVAPVDLVDPTFPLTVTVPRNPPD